MPFRRKASRRGRRSSSSRRRVNWVASFFQGNSIVLDQPSVAVYWAKWPSGLTGDISGTGGTILPAAVDDTWIRALVEGNVKLHTHGAVPTTNTTTVAFGLIAWDTANPAALEATVVGNDVAPSPVLNAGLDWLLRIPFTFVQDNFVLSISADTWINSRAMRKLPPNTGILGCLAAVDYLDTDATPIQTVSWNFDVRGAYKAGGYTA